jgi:hypothetical protein
MALTHRKLPHGWDDLQGACGGTLEHLVAHVLQTTAQGERPKDWRRTVGMFDGDPIRQEIIAEGRRRPEKDRLQTRP